MKKKVIMMLSCIAAVAIATVVGKSVSLQSTNEACTLLIQDVEALAKCDVSAKATKNVFGIDVPVATAYLECDGQGTCQIPSNEFGLTASCSGKQIKYEIRVMGKKVN